MKNMLDRRSFLKNAGGAALGATALSVAGAGSPGAIAEARISFRSHWPGDVRRHWAGPEYWLNPLQDWRLSEGRLECFSPGEDRNVVLLTREVASRSGELALSVRLGRIDSAPLEKGFVGFRIGIKDRMKDYRAAALYGEGMNAGIDADGRLFIGSLDESAPKLDTTNDLHLRLEARPSAAGYNVVLHATDLHGGHAAETTREVPEDSLTGMLALVCSSAAVSPTPAAAMPVESTGASHDFSFYPPHQRRGGTMRFWFADWTVAGSKVDEHDDRTYGPILFALYTVSRNTLKLSAQFPPLGNAPRNVTLQVSDQDGSWKSIATAEMDTDAWNATFRVTGWDASRAYRYRVLYSMPDASGVPKLYTYSGTIHRDPVDKQDVVVGLLTCIWDLGFPHSDFTTNLAHHKPDILFWTGDQVYQPVGGFGFLGSRAPELIQPAMLDFLRKWYIFGWAVGDLTRDIPSVCMTDDHDMYQGNIWGCGGRPTNPAAAVPGSRAPEQDSGGYVMAPRWVNMVQRLQTSHLPDAFDPTPVKQGIGVYFTDLQWGGVSFAILEDRKWKSAPKEQFPGANIYNGFAQSPGWDPTSETSPKAELLGQRQLDFLEAWAANWSGGTWMKFVVTQTLFGCLHTEPKGVNSDSTDTREAIPPVGVYLEGDHLVADYDSGGWPQNGRDAAILKWRKAFAAHLCGDQHLGSTSHYGVEEFRDGVYSVCTPAISNIFPRRWFPPQPAPNALPGKRNTGDYYDGFGNRMTVLGVANPAQHPGPGLEGLRFRVTGYTILTCNRATRKTTIAEWPRWVDPSASGARPYDGWPIAIDQIDNGLWGAQWQLDRIETAEFKDPVVQVQDESNGEVVYTLRINGRSFTPRVRKAGNYTVIAYDPDGDYLREWNKVSARRIG